MVTRDRRRSPTCVSSSRTLCRMDLTGRRQLMIFNCFVASGLMQCHMLWVHSFLNVRKNPPHMTHRYHHQSAMKLYHAFESDTLESESDDDFDDILILNESDDNEDEYGGDDEEFDRDDALSLEEIKMNLSDYVTVAEGDEDYDEADEDYKDDELATSPKAMGYELDASVEIIAKQFIKTYQNIRSKSDALVSVPKVAIIPGWFPEMKEWTTEQYNQLLHEVSQTGSVRDTETILYHMIQQHQQRNDCAAKELLVSDETFYHVYTSYQYRQKQQKKNKNKKNRGIGFKVEQLLAIQDALSNNHEFVTATATVSSNPSSTIHPSLRTLNVVLSAMTLDRIDNRIALRAHRIWNRMLQIMEENKQNNDLDSDASVLPNAALSTLICCARVPRMTATPTDKLSSFTVALECFNWATTNSATNDSDPPQRQQGSVYYMYFLRSCRTLLSETSESKRDAVVEAAFRRACANGYVDTRVVKAMEEIASDALMLRLLGGFIEDEQNLPVEWSRNCVTQKSKVVEESTVSKDR